VTSRPVRARPFKMRTLEPGVHDAASGLSFLVRLPRLPHDGLRSGWCRPPTAASWGGHLVVLMVSAQTGPQGCRFAGAERRDQAMIGYARKTIVAVVAGTALLAGTAGSASAANNQNQDGLVNVAVGDVTILQDVNIGVAAQVAATICGVKVGPVAVLGQAVDRSGATSTVCTTDQGPVTLTQN